MRQRLPGPPLLAVCLPLRQNIRIRDTMTFDRIRDGRTYLALCSREYEDLHLTVIHVPVYLPDPPLLAVCLPLRLRVTGEAPFGTPDAPVRALTIERAPALLALRADAEEALRAVGVEWATRWPFNPHVTLRQNIRIPDTMTFDRIEWRR
jgi:hypothetical protein